MVEDTSSGPLRALGEVPPQPVDVHGEVAVLPAVEQHDRHPVAVLGLQLRVGVDVHLLAAPKPTSAPIRVSVSAAVSHRWQPARVSSVSRAAQLTVGVSPRRPVSPSSRSRARLTLPVSECGSADRKFTDVGTLYRASGLGRVARSSSKVDRGAGLRHHDRPHGGAGPRVGDADDRALRDRRVGVEHPLDLGRVDVEAADQDQVAAPVDQVQVAVGVPVGEVAGAEPAVGVRARRRRRASSRRTGWGRAPRSRPGPSRWSLGGAVVRSPSVAAVSRSSSSTPGNGPPMQLGLARPVARVLATTGEASVSP